MNRQSGLGLPGFLLVAALVVVAALVAFKAVPAYVEYATIGRQFRALAADPGLQSGVRADIESAFARRATTENITSITPRDLEITRSGGGLVISANYAARIPLAGNVSLCLDFHPSSAP